MRNIYLLWGLLTCIAFTSCYEEDALTPTEGGIELPVSYTHLTLPTNSRV